MYYVFWWCLPPLPQLLPNPPIYLSSFKYSIIIIFLTYGVQIVPSKQSRVGPASGISFTYLRGSHLYGKLQLQCSICCLLLVAPQLRAGLVSPPCWVSVWLELTQVLGMLSQPPWVHTCSFPAVCRKCRFLLVTHCLWLLCSSIPTSKMTPEPREEGVWHPCPS